MRVHSFKILSHIIDASPKQIYDFRKAAGKVDVVRGLLASQSLSLEAPPREAGTSRVKPLSLTLIIKLRNSAA
jgi:hypothetical protein